MVKKTIAITNDWKTYLCCALYAMIEILPTMFPEWGIPEKWLTVATGGLLAAGGASFRHAIQKAKKAAENK